jgi:sugar/nucleoside kinase (ribokinase family)
LKGSLDELLKVLNEFSEEISVAVMPDFFLDRLITLKLAPTEFVMAIENVAKRKGGSIDGINQTDLRGGNAANTTSALAALGIKVTPIVCTNKLGLQQLNFHFKPLGVDMSHVKILSKASLTTALELTGEGKNANVMLRDLGSLADFGPANLSDKDYELIKDSDYVCVFNWAGTRNHGTELAQAVFRTVKALGKGKTYFDTADPAPNREKIPELMETILKSRLVDVLSLNENEAVTYATQLRGDFRAELNTLSFEELAMNSARFLADQLSARIDFHTTSFSVTFNGGNQVMVPAFNVKTLRVTGAGDAWNAGNILADAHNLSDECRLTLANAVAACYLANPNGVHPSREQVKRFIKEYNA